MVVQNYSIEDQNGVLPLGTLVSVNTDNGPAKVVPDPINAGRYEVQYPMPGVTTAIATVNGRAPLVYSADVPLTGGEAETNNPLVLSPL